jgi:hypothetical protein
MASELANLVQLYIEGCENCCSVSIIDLERMRRGIEALETALADMTKRAKEAEGMARDIDRCEDCDTLVELSALTTSFTDDGRCYCERCWRGYSAELTATKEGHDG